MGNFVTEREDYAGNLALRESFPLIRCRGILDCDVFSFGHMLSDIWEAHDFRHLFILFIWL